MSANLPEVPEAVSEGVEQASGLPVEQEFERILAEKLPEPEARLVATKLTTVAMQMEMFAGPLPPPQVLEGYEKAIPGLGERVVKMAETQQSFRHEIVRREIEIEDRNSWRGLHYGAIVAGMLVICATVCALAGQPWVAGAMMATAAVGMVPAVMNGWRDKTQPDERPPEPPKPPQQVR